MLFTIFNVFNILIAAAMIVLILMQRGEGADAGAAFGGGSSGTVFGARGSATFLSRATAVLAGLFFLLSLGMAMHLGHTKFKSPQQQLGVMAGVAAQQTATAASAGKPAAAAVPAAAKSAAAAPSAVPAPSAAPAATKGNAAVPAAKPAPKPAAASSSGAK